MGHIIRGVLIATIITDSQAGPIENTERGHLIQHIPLVTGAGRERGGIGQDEAHRLDFVQLT